MVECETQTRQELTWLTGQPCVGTGQLCAQGEIVWLIAAQEQVLCFTSRIEQTSAPLMRQLPLHLGQGAMTHRVESLRWAAQRELFLVRVRLSRGAFVLGLRVRR